jgi:hypothetical protein
MAGSIHVCDIERRSLENVKAYFYEYEQGPLRKQQIIVQAIIQKLLWFSASASALSPLS